MAHRFLLACGALVAATAAGCGGSGPDAADLNTGNPDTGVDRGAGDSIPIGARARRPG